MTTKEVRELREMVYNLHVMVLDMAEKLDIEVCPPNYRFDLISSEEFETA